MGMSGHQRSAQPHWGKMPEEIKHALRSRYWQNSRVRKQLLTGEKPFPIEIPLKPPKGQAVLEDLAHLQYFVSAWKRFEQQMGGVNIDCQVVWQNRTFRSLAEQRIPTRLKIGNIFALAQVLGETEVQQLQHWQSQVQFLFEALSNALIDESQQPQLKPILFQTLIQYLDTFSYWKSADLQLLVKCLSQLHEGMGSGSYLRALPIQFVDTKFMETHLKLIEALASVLLDSAIEERGLMAWLDCQPKPKDWLLIKPLCPQVQSALGGLPLLRLSSDILLNYELPASHLLVIENEQSCLALNELPNTIAISGGGKNLTWMRAHWLVNKQIAYWGDIDSEGLGMLSDARSKQSHLTPLMMDEQTVTTFEERMVDEPNSVSKTPPALTPEERILFEKLRSDTYQGRRLEQERLSMEYIMYRLQEWVESCNCQ